MFVIDVKDYAYDLMFLWITVVQVPLRDFDNKLIAEDNQVCHKGVFEFIGGATHCVFFFPRFYVILADLSEGRRVCHVLKFIRV